MRYSIEPRDKKDRKDKDIEFGILLKTWVKI